MGGSAEDSTRVFILIIKLILKGRNQYIQSPPIVCYDNRGRLCAVLLLSISIVKREWKGRNEVLSFTLQTPLYASNPSDNKRNRVFLRLLNQMGRHTKYPRVGNS